MCNTPDKKRYSSEKAAGDALVKIKINAALHPGRPASVKRKNAGKVECRYYACAGHYHLTSKELSYA
jgi:hypothetical protein